MALFQSVVFRKRFPVRHGEHAAVNNDGCAILLDCADRLGVMEDGLLSLIPRAGEKPRTNPTMPHQQESDNAPPEMQEALFDKVVELKGVRTGRSLVSVPGARAFFLDEASAQGPPEAFMAGTEFAHLHPPHDGSLHLALPAGLARKVIEAGWGEFHPGVDMGIMPPNSLMVFGPRNDEELETVWKIVQASHGFASGTLEATR